MKALMTEDWMKIAKFFAMHIICFLEDFGRTAFEVFTECNDGKIRKSWFYRGYYVTHKWKKDVDGQWFQFWTTTVRNPNVRRVKKERICDNCSFNTEGWKYPSECTKNTEMHGDKKLTKLLHDAAEFNDHRIDQREDKAIYANYCLVLDPESKLPDEPTVSKQLFPTTPEIVADVSTAIEKCERQEKMLKGILALDKRTLESFYARQNELIEFLDSCQIDEFEEVLKLNNLLILTKDGKFRVVKGQYKVTDKDVRTSIMHMRDILRIDTNILKHSIYGTLTGYLAGLEKKTISIKPMRKIKVARNEVETGTWMVYKGGSTSKKRFMEVASSNNIPMLWKMLGKDLTPGFKFEALLEPKQRLTYNIAEEWDYGTEEGVTQEQIMELVYHFNGKEKEEA